MRLRPSSVSLLPLTLIAAVGVSGCRLDGGEPIGFSLPVTEALSAADYRYGPSYDELAYAEPAPIGRPGSWDDGYAWGERAYATDRAFWGAAPDYAYAYEDSTPFVWETEDDWRLYAEPYDDGQRFYYWEPEQRYPYLIRDDRYAYAYDPYGRLVSAYDGYGRLLPEDLLYQLAGPAGVYLARAVALHEAADRADRYRVPEELWLARAAPLVRAQTVWIEAPERDPRWLAWRAQDDRKIVKAFEKEEKRRAKAAERYRRALYRDVPNGVGPVVRTAYASPPPVTVAPPARRFEDRIERRGGDDRGPPARVEARERKEVRQAAAADVRRAERAERKARPAAARAEPRPERVKADRPAKIERERPKAEAAGRERVERRAAADRGPERREKAVKVRSEAKVERAEVERVKADRGGGAKAVRTADAGAKAKGGDKPSGGGKGGGDKGGKGRG